MDGILDGLDLDHHRLVNGEAAGGIDNHQVVVVLLGMLDGMLCDSHRVLALGLAVDGHLDLLGDGLQLLDSGGTVNVTCDEQRIAFFLAVFQAVGEFSGESGFTGTLQTRHQDDGRVALDAERGFLSAHELCQLVMDDFHHQLARVDGIDDVLAHSLGLDVVDKLLGDRIAHVGVNERTAHFLKGRCYIDFGDAALSFQDFK